MKNKLTALTEKKNQLDSFLPHPAELISNLDEWLKVELTYTSNAIEGNTLSRQETALVIEKGLTVEGKTVREHMEAINHALALDLVKTLSSKKRQNITEADILDIHKLILTRIDDNNAGRYRRVSVRIAGSTVIMSNPLKVPDLMKEFIDWLRSDNSDHPVTLAARAHYKLVTIHPFTDGNGRTARLLMNLLLRQSGYPMAIIRKEDRQKYISFIEKAQLDGSIDDYLELIYEAADRSLDIYLEAAQGSLPSPAKSKLAGKLLKIGQLAKLTAETVPTLRFWTREGLLEVKDYSPGGYQLYDPSMVERVRQIRQWQNESRLTLNEIKHKLNTPLLP